MPSNHPTVASPRAEVAAQPERSGCLSLPIPRPFRRRRRDLLDALQERGGLADLAYLEAVSSRKTVRRAVEAGVLERLGPGVYGWPQLRLRAEPGGGRDRSWARWKDGPSQAEVARLAQERAWARAHKCTLSHRSAARQHDWAMLELPTQPEVVLPRYLKASSSLRATGIVRRRIAALHVEPELAATDALLTALHCAADLPFAEALAIADSALRSHTVGKVSLVNAADAYRGPGAEQARRVAAAADGGAANPFESALRALVLQVENLAVEAQVKIAGEGFSARVDLADQALRLVIEADSYEFHGDRERFTADCVRYNELAVRGWLVLRFTLSQVLNSPDWVLGTLRGAVETCRVRQSPAFATPARMPERAPAEVVPRDRLGRNDRAARQARTTPRAHQRFRNERGVVKVKNRPAADIPALPGQHTADTRDELRRSVATMTLQTPSYALNDGNSLPAIGFGTYPLKGDDGVAAIVSALEVGYRLLDSAVNYENEVEVGEALRRSGLPREEVLIATKIPGRDHARDKAIASVEASLERMGLDYLDAVLIHWPNPSVGLYREAWQALVEVRERGLARSIGVSNFTETHLREIIADTGVTPAVNQLELHPYFPQEHMRAVNAELGIRTESWSPLGKRNAPFDEGPVAAAAEAHGVSPAQAILRWQVQIGSTPFPKSATSERQRSNFDVFSFELTDAEVAAITGLGRHDGRLFDGDPNTHEEM